MGRSGFNDQGRHWRTDEPKERGRDYALNSSGLASTNLGHSAGEVRGWAEAVVGYRIGPFELRPRERKLLREGREVPLGTRAFEILMGLIEANGDVVSKEALLARVWPGVIVGENNLHTQISALRKALGENANIIASAPGRGYRFAGPLETVEALRPPAARVERQEPDRPSIAVLPFESLSDDREQGYFADGMAEELITALSRMHWLFVIARNSSFTYRGRVTDASLVAEELGVRYVVTGSVRRALRRLRIACHLVDAPGRTEIWSDRFDGDMDDVFDLQDRVTASIIGAIEPRLREVEVARARAKPTQDLRAYDHYLRALGHLVPRTAENYEQALAELDAALVLDGNFALAMALAAHCRYVRLLEGWAVERQPEIAAMAQLAETALARAPEDPTVLAHGGFVLAWCGRSLSASLQLVERATRLNPNSAHGALVDGWVRMQAGKADEAIERLQTSIALSPLDPLSAASAMAATGQAHLVSGRHEDAARWAERAIREAADLGYAHRVRVAALALSGRAEEATVAARAFLELEPGFTVGAFLERLPIRETPATRALAAGLRLAGLPES
jgi:TolB-like protein/Tfp pilus assembly protein PilF